MRNWPQSRIDEFLNIAPQLDAYLRTLLNTHHHLLNGLDSGVRIFEATMHLEREIKIAESLQRKSRKLKLPHESS